MNKKKNEFAIHASNKTDEAALFDYVSTIIENRIHRAQVQANQEKVLIFWEVGKYIVSVLLGEERAKYGKQIVVTLSQQLQAKYGMSFDYPNVTQMMLLQSGFLTLRFCRRCRQN